MNKPCGLTVLLVVMIGISSACAGTLSFVPVPATQSDSNCGIAAQNGYTSAVDGGNTRGTDRMINGITFYALPAKGQSNTADNCILSASSGSLANAGGTSKTIQADGMLKEVLSDMTFNNQGSDDSQQEIVLDPNSLEEGATYDLRVYICNGSSQNRQVNLIFYGDGRTKETGFFNEDDARTSPGAFKDANQVYYINYRYTWDGDSTPGIAIIQKSGGAPFCLYALTNQLIEAAGTKAVASAPVAGGGKAEEDRQPQNQSGPGPAPNYERQESDEIGVESDQFYASESLNAHGSWIKVSKWGTCWQPTDVPNGWCPYTNGSWRQSDDFGWTFVSDEPWAWACYHYGRWCAVRTGCGWAWVPGKVWAASWVSWRQGRDESAIGWAPLPPEADCDVGIGVSSWVDRSSNIGPDCYTFIHIRDFGSDSYLNCGCIYDRARNPSIIIDTFNCTNIVYHKRVNIYCGGPDWNWCNTQIRKHGGKECGKIYLNRYDDPAKLDGKSSKLEGSQLGLLSPQIDSEKHSKHPPKVAESLRSSKISHGWDSVKGNKDEGQLRNYIAQETKGKNARNSPAQLPPELAQRLGRQRETGSGKTEREGGKAAGQTEALSDLVDIPNRQGKRERPDAQTQTEALSDQVTPHVGGKGKRRAHGDVAAGPTGGAGQIPHFDQHPRAKGQIGAGGANISDKGKQQASSFPRGGLHPGQSLKKQSLGAQAETPAPSPSVSSGLTTPATAEKEKTSGPEPGSQAELRSVEQNPTIQGEVGTRRHGKRHRRQQEQLSQEQVQPQNTAATGSNRASGITQTQGRSAENAQPQIQGQVKPSPPQPGASSPNQQAPSAQQQTKRQRGAARKDGKKERGRVTPTPSPHWPAY